MVPKETTEYHWEELGSGQDIGASSTPRGLLRATSIRSSSITRSALQINENTQKFSDLSVVWRKVHSTSLSSTFRAPKDDNPFALRVVDDPDKAIRVSHFEDAIYGNVPPSECEKKGAIRSQ